ncbi:ATP-binding cassette subfamily B protein [Breznakia blatticola]|uniref:ATP-binding cassette subfamily B protein n=1 Tax=Breznakia blatticola TaxID=1754012 RepID=A0A4R7ZEY6_9FIRM|nr:ABC transporter ATP-binding protein [Breznakia blatticola]TDW14758.1 ATP-binding cassette subfamily B protein [Breznakia blatticola]
MSNQQQKQRRAPQMGFGHGGNRGGTEKAKDFKKAVRQMMGYISAYKIQLIVIMIFAVLSTIFMIVGPKILGEATDILVTGITNKISGKGGIDFDGILDIIVKLLGMYLFSALCGYIQGFMMTGMTQKIAYNLRNEITEKINRLPLSYFDKTSQGDVLSRVTNDVDTLSQGLQQSVTNLITSVISVIGYAIMMFSVSWMMTIVALLVLPFSAIIVMMITKRSQPLFFAQQQSLGALNGHVEEMYGGHMIVKAFNGEEDSVQQFKEYNDQLYKSGWKSQFLSGLMMPITQFIGNVGYVLVCLVGGYLSVNSTVSILGLTITGVGISIGGIQSFITYVRSFNQPISQMAQIMNQLQSAAAASERVFEFLGEKEMEPDTANPVEIYDEKGNIIIPSTVTFDNVKFGYSPDKMVINDFSLRVGEGQKVAIVGPTGAGKTTIVKLLMRFYELNGGAIYVGDHNIDDFRREDLRSMFGMVLQDAWLFSGTVMENLRYAKLDATDEEVYEASKTARVDHFVKTLDQGYNTMLDEETSNISQGQKQLLTIARAFLADPKILILDEATSNVDTRTEVLIQEGMDELMKGRTSFVIAHRLSTIRNADVIIVMDKGDIVEIGDHDELLAKDGFYAKLYNAQFEEGEE